MTKIKKVEIECSNCGKLFPSPIFFGDTASFQSSMMSGNTTNCPNCGKTVPCNKEDMKITTE